MILKKAMGKKELSEVQRQLLQAAGGPGLAEEQLLAIADGTIDPADLDDEQLVRFLEAVNLLYRAGEQLITDLDYDFVFLAELQQRQPDHPYLHRVEPETLPEMKTVELPVRMLSTEKAYDFATVQRWAKRIEKAAAEMGIDFASLRFRATPKLDGYAAYDDGEMLYTRGDGRRGTDISRVFARGLQVAGGARRGLGAGEIVVSRKYFREHLAEHFDNSRNFQASLIREKELAAPAAEAIRLGEAVFFPFAELPAWGGSWTELADQFTRIVADARECLDYDIDGVVFEVTDPALRERLGATRHHHRWQLAYKQNTESAEVTVLRVIPQTSRSGRVSPVAEVEPTRLSGALIRRVTAHHYRMVVEKGIGPGALILLSRSGEVIPKIEAVIHPVTAELPESCPSCGSRLVWEADHLQCVNTMGCPAQISHAMAHFFKTLGNVDGFGPAAIAKIHAVGIRSIAEVYRLQAEDFVALGFGPKQSQNMVTQLLRSRTEPLEEWRFLAAFGIFRMGPGNCERLLAACPLSRVTVLSREEIIALPGFHEKTAEAILSGLEAVAPLFQEMLGIGFNLVREEPSTDEPLAGGLLAGQLIVFTGTMRHGSREEMKQQARALGARVAESVTGKTDLLVCGEKVGGAKLKKAQALGVVILSEEEYLQRIA